MNALKCPNPSCPYLFDPSGVPPGVVLTCPRCGMRFTMGAPPPAVASPPPAAPPADLDFGAPGEIARPRSPREAPAEVGGSGTRTTVALVVVAAALLLGVGATIYFRLVHTPARPDRGGPAAEWPDLDLAIDPPGDGWVSDDDLRAKLGPPFIVAFRKGDPDNAGETDPRLAFAAKDYGTREPRAGELREGLMRPLGAVLDDVTPTNLDGATWLGRPAAAVDFRAHLKGDGPVVAGQAFAVGRKGIGYWAVGWAAEADAAEQLPALAAVRGKARLLEGREKWSPKEAARHVFAGEKAAYALADDDALWTVPDPSVQKPTDLDPHADLLLVARERQKGRDRPAEATAVVLVLDNLADEPMPVARAAIEAQRRAEVGDPARTVTFAELPDTPESTPPVVRLKSMVADDKNQTRLHAVSAIRVGDHVVAVHAWCPWAERGALEDAMVRLAASLRERK